MSLRNAKTGPKWRTPHGLALEESARKILAHVKGELKLPTRRVVLPDDVGVKRFRAKLEEALAPRCRERPKHY